MKDNEYEEDAIMEDGAQNKLYRPRNKSASYSEISSEVRRAAIASSVAQHREALRRNSVNNRVDLRDATALETEIDAYMASCENSGMIPTVLGLSVFLGYARPTIYYFLANHPDTESARLLNNFRCASAAILAQSSLTRSVDNITSIFLLKNAGMGLNDSSSLEIFRGDDLPRPTAEQIARKWEKADLDGVELPDE